MRISILHNQYFNNNGGEDTVVSTESALLKKHGFKVKTHQVKNLGSLTLKEKASFLNLKKDDPKIVDYVTKIFAQDKPDIVHVHNFFFNLGPTLHKAFHALGVPVVQTLHNYRLACVNSQLLREQKTCLECVRPGGSYKGVTNRCYRDSFQASLAVKLFQNSTIQDPSWINSVKYFICLTEFSRQIFLKTGIPAEKLVVKGNTINPSVSDYESCNKSSDFVYIGRLSPEKGILQLLEAWEKINNASLSIIGTGPLEEKIRSIAPPNVNVIGKLDHSEIYSHLYNAKACVIPSLWFEGFPMVALESLSCATPVITSKNETFKEILGDMHDNFNFEPNNPSTIVSCINAYLKTNLSLQRARAKQLFEEKYSPELNFKRLIEIYEMALN